MVSVFMHQEYRKSYKFADGCDDFCTAIYVIIGIPNRAIARITTIIFGNIMMTNDFYRKERKGLEQT